MPLGGLFGRTLIKTRPLPRPVRYAATAGIVGVAFAIRGILEPFMPNGWPFILSFLAILISSGMFDGGCGILATALCAVLAATLYMPPVAAFGVEHWVALGMFAFVGTATALVLETLHHNLETLAAAERHRRLLLHEYRHRSRNDLQSLVALLLLRARSAPSAEAKAALKEAADHARALARVHSRLQEVAPDATGQAVIDTRAFVAGLVEDLDKGAAGDGLRPVAVVAHAEAHPLPSERAVQLGLVINEVVTNALKYAFPADRPGLVAVRFWRDGADYILEIRDDGVGMAAPSAAQGSGLGTRLLRALASQLRGNFIREPAPGGGTLCTLRFPAGAPDILHGRR